MADLSNHEQLALDALNTLLGVLRMWRDAEPAKDAEMAKVRTNANRNLLILRDYLQQKAS